MLVLVLGSNGMLGHDIVRTLSKHSIPHMALTKDHCQIGDELTLHRIFRSHRINFVVNCAAYTNVPGAENDVMLARKINAEDVEILARTCSIYNIPLVHFSTDYIFDGKKNSAYIETDESAPLSVYGKTKLEGEYAIKNNCTDYKIFRLQWLYGLNGKNFVTKIFDQIRSGQDLKIVDDQFGSPCSTGFVSEIILKVMRSWIYAPSGIYHLTHDDSCSWFEFAKYICHFLHEEKRVQPVSSNHFPSPVGRPLNSIMDSSKLKNSFNIPNLGSWKSDFDQYILKNQQKLLEGIRI